MKSIGVTIYSSHICTRSINMFYRIYSQDKKTKVKSISITWDKGNIIKRSVKEIDFN